MISAREALERLIEGNRRFVTEQRKGAADSSSARRRELAVVQEPIAIVLGCSDSRVPPEIVFDQGLGDLFVVRVAGNVTAPSQVESIEFAVERLDVRLVVVLGHSNCGAVLATLEELEAPAQPRSPGLGTIVDRIRPVVEPLLKSEPREDREAFLARAVRANVRAAGARLRQGSPILEKLIRDDGLVVACAEYSLATGAVEFLDGLPQPG